MLEAYFKIMLLFVFQTSTFDSPNSLYLKIFRFIRYDVKRFRDKDTFSIPLTEQLVFFDFKVLLLLPVARIFCDNVVLKSYFYCFQYIYRHRVLKKH